MKINYSFFVYLVLIIFITILFYVLFFFRYDLKKIKSDYYNLKSKLKNNKLTLLLNGSSINNIPKINLIQANSSIAITNNCQNGPLFIGSDDMNFTHLDCVRTCMNDKAKLLKISKNEVITFNNVVLDVGNYCNVNEQPACNLKTSIALMTMDSIVCSPKYPELYGGDLGNTVVACNNLLINDSRNILWDFKYDRYADPWITELTHPHEKLPNEQFRFRCKYLGKDNRQNFFIPHPFNRFHPIKNYCADLIYNAPSTILTVFDADDPTSYKCDCGNFSETRSKNIYPHDASSQCANKSFEIKNIIKRKNKMILPYKCFNIHSPMQDITQFPPCPTEQFLQGNSQIASVELEFTESSSDLIESPMYERFSDKGIFIKRFHPITE